MAAGQKNPGAMPPPLAPPPAQPVSGIARQYSQIAPQLTEKPTGADPVKELNARQAAAIAKATGKPADGDQSEAREGAPPPPKAQAAPSSASADTSGSKKKDAPRSESAAKDTPGSATKPPSSSGEDSEDEETSGAGDAAGAPRGPRYTVAALRKYAEEHPEEAAELRKVFNLPDDTRQEWIRLKNRARKVRGDIASDRDASLAALRVEREATEAAAKAIDDAAGKLGPVVDLWDAVGERIRANPENPQPDFEAADAAFQQNAGISIDDYMRLRARRGVSNPEAVRLRAENAKLQRQLAGKPSEQVAAAVAKETPKKAAAEVEEGTPAGTPAAAKTPKPKAKREAKDWSEELPERHKLRQIADWNVKLDNEMRKFHDPDLDEYDADPEEVAAKVLERELRLLAEPDPEDEDDDQPKAKKGKRGGTLADDGIPGAGKLKPKKPTAKVESDVDDEDKVKVGKMTWQQRQKWAIERAMQRGAGELE